jgi:hypothetical protein
MFATKTIRIGCRRRRGSWRRQRLGCSTWQAARALPPCTHSCTRPAPLHTYQHHTDIRVDGPHEEIVHDLEHAVWVARLPQHDGSARSATPPNDQAQPTPRRRPPCSPTPRRPARVARRGTCSTHALEDSHHVPDRERAPEVHHEAAAAGLRARRSNPVLRLVCLVTFVRERLRRTCARGALGYDTPVEGQMGPCGMDPRARAPLPAAPTTSPQLTAAPTAPSTPPRHPNHAQARMATDIPAIPR